MLEHGVSVPRIDLHVVVGLVWWIPRKKTSKAGFGFSPLHGAVLFARRNRREEEETIKQAATRGKEQSYFIITPVMFIDVRPRFSDPVR